MSKNNLEFEKPLLELEDKIKELKRFMTEEDLDLTDEIERLREKADRVKEEIFAELEPWQILKLARHTERPTTLEYIDLICDDFIQLHGDRNHSDDQALVGGIGKIDRQPLTIIGHQKGKDTEDNLNRNFGMAHPEGYRKALRLMKQAEKFNRPVLTLVNTPGAYPGIQAEERGQAEAIARNMREMARLEVPVIIVITGEGGSGGALGVGVGDRIMMLEYTYYSVCSPEACAAILWEDAGKAKKAAEALKLTAKDLLELDIIDEIVPEPVGGAHKDHHKSAELIKGAVLTNLQEIQSLSVPEMLEKRYDKFRKMGEYIEQSKIEAANSE